MKTDIPDGARAPHFWEAILSLVSLIVGISISIVVYGLDPHVPMLLGVIVASLVALRCGFSWQNIQNGMVRGITNALPATIILIIVGVLIGIWILAGVVPTLIFYGLKILSPSIFLPATVIICALASLATGSSWGTTGTIGVALMGVGAGLNFPLPLVAGAVLSGAYFGDKMSPLSDTTNMAPALAGTDLFTHIKHMTYTTGVAFALTLVIEIIIGLQYSGGDGDLARVETMLAVLKENFTINLAMILPPVVVLVVSYRRMPAIPGITLGVVAAVILAVGLQGANYEALVNAAFGGYSADTGNPDVDTLLSRGGMDSMMYTISLVIVAMMFGGVMERTNQLKAIADKVLTMVKSDGSLIASTVLTGIGANMVLCDQYMAIVMGARTYAQAYRERGLAPENLSRAVEDSATVTANLVPWNSGGAYQAATLGVATLAYLPFAFFCWLSPLVTMLFGFMGWTIWRSDQEQHQESAGQEAAKAN
ncbi:Na+/H+ antiporter NhaC [Ruegeria sp. 2012CJ41-6]|uniref:Na+/H+ antiporter NhaC n=1 Tax=Ruegeria spongiae TaxID=2942209 RepID=A0ABT0Q4V6_9RHOB|nr:Na+/H+ antiporter NhaC [Ruegeria spongiae]MCL6284218.1 Na+/H+ antiporter NhaC [Ruegeria spongiae]